MLRSPKWLSGSPLDTQPTALLAGLSTACCLPGGRAAVGGGGVGVTTSGVAATADRDVGDAGGGCVGEADGTTTTGAGGPGWACGRPTAMATSTTASTAISPQAASCS